MGLWYYTIRTQTRTETQNDFYLLQFSSDSHETFRADSSHLFLHIYTTFTFTRHSPLDLFNFQVEGSTPTFFFFLFVFSSTSRVLSPLLRGGGCNRPMVYYCSSSLLYPIALRRLRLFNRSTTLSLFAFLFLPSPSSPSGSHFSPSPSPSLPLSTACLCATQGQSSLSFAHASKLLRS